MEPDEKPKKRIGGGFGGYNPDESIEVAKTDTFTGKEKFEFEDFKDAEVPYHEQGDESMYTEENLRIREKIRDDKVLTKQIHKFWSVFDMNVDGEVDKKEYTAMVIRLSKVLIPNLEEEQAVTIAEDEWETDSKGKKALNYEMFHNAVFQLVDHWTTTADVREYRNFVRVLLRRITKKVKTFADGTKVVRGPYKSMKARLRMLKRKDKHRAESARGPSPDAAPAVSTPSSTEEKKVEATTTEAEAPMEVEDPEILDESNYFEEDVESIHDEEEEMETSDEEEEEGVERMYEMVPYDEIEEASEDEDEGEEEEEEEGEEGEEGEEEQAVEEEEGEKEEIREAAPVEATTASEEAQKEEEESKGKAVAKAEAEAEQPTAVGDEKKEESAAPASTSPSAAAEVEREAPAGDGEGEAKAEKEVVAAAATEGATAAAEEPAVSPAEESAAEASEATAAGEEKSGEVAVAEGEEPRVSIQPPSGRESSADPANVLKKSQSDGEELSTRKRKKKLAKGKSAHNTGLGTPKRPFRPRIMSIDRGNLPSLPALVVHRHNSIAPNSPLNGPSSKWATPKASERVSFKQLNPDEVGSALEEAKKHQSGAAGEEEGGEEAGEEGAQAVEEVEEANVTAEMLEELPSDETGIDGDKFPVPEEEVEEDAFDTEFAFEERLRQGPTSILICGPKGSGRSTLGRGLADTLGMPFIDIATLLERAEKKFAPKPVEGEEGEEGEEKKAEPLVGSDSDPEWLAVSALRKGEAVPAEVLAQLVTNAISSLSLPRFIVDDDAARVVELEELFPAGEDGEREGLPTFAVNLRVNDEELARRKAGWTVRAADGSVEYPPLYVADKKKSKKRRKPKSLADATDEDFGIFEGEAWGYDENEIKDKKEAIAKAALARAIKLAEAEENGEEVEEEPEEEEGEDAEEEEEAQAEEEEEGEAKAGPPAGPLKRPEEIDSSDSITGAVSMDDASSSFGEAVESLLAKLSKEARLATVDGAAAPRTVLAQSLSKLLLLGLAPRALPVALDPPSSVADAVKEKEGEEGEGEPDLPEVSEEEERQWLEEEGVKAMKVALQEPKKRKDLFGIFGEEAKGEGEEEEAEEAAVAAAPLRYSRWGKYCPVAMGGLLPKPRPPKPEPEPEPEPEAAAAGEEGEGQGEGEKEEGEGEAKAESAGEGEGEGEGSAEGEKAEEGTAEKSESQPVAETEVEEEDPGFFPPHLSKGRFDHAVLYGGRVFLFCSKLAQEIFMESPTKVLSLSPSLLLDDEESVGVLVVGPPKAGRTTLAAALAKKMDGSYVAGASFVEGLKEAIAGPAAAEEEKLVQAGEGEGEGEGEAKDGASTSGEEVKELTEEEKAQKEAESLARVVEYVKSLPARTVIDLTHVDAGAISYFAKAVDALAVEGSKRQWKIVAIDGANDSLKDADTGKESFSDALLTVVEREANDRKEKAHRLAKKHSLRHVKFVDVGEDTSEVEVEYPYRILVVGERGSGRRTVGKGLADKLAGLIHIDAEEALRKDTRTAAFFRAPTPLPSADGSVAEGEGGEGSTRTSQKSNKEQSGRASVEVPKEEEKEQQQVEGYYAISDNEIWAVVSSALKTAEATGSREGKEHSGWILTGLHLPTQEREEAVLNKLKLEFAGVQVVVLAGLTEEERKNRLDNTDELDNDAELEEKYKQIGQRGPQHVVGPSEESTRSVFAFDMRRVDALQSKEEVLEEVVAFVKGKKPTDAFFIQLSEFEEAWQKAKEAIEASAVLKDAMVGVPVQSEARVLLSQEGEEEEGQKKSGSAEASMHDSKEYVAALAMSGVNPLAPAKAVAITADEIEEKGGIGRSPTTPVAKEYAKKYEEEEEEEQEEGQEEGEAEVVLTPPLPLGPCGVYCPYTYKDFGGLCLGRRDCAVMYDGRVSLCSSEAAREEVLKNPAYYLGNAGGRVEEDGGPGVERDGVHEPPPPHLLVVGGTHAKEGVEAAAERLAGRYELVHVRPAVEFAAWLDQKKEAFSLKWEMRGHERKREKEEIEREHNEKLKAAKEQKLKEFEAAKKAAEEAGEEAPTMEEEEESEGPDFTAVEEKEAADEEAKTAEQEELDGYSMISAVFLDHFVQQSLLVAEVRKQGFVISLVGKVPDGFVLQLAARSVFIDSTAVVHASEADAVAALLPGKWEEHKKEEAEKKRQKKKAKAEREKARAAGEEVEEEEEEEEEEGDEESKKAAVEEALTEVVKEELESIDACIEEIGKGAEDTDGSAGDGNVVLHIPFGYIRNRRAERVAKDVERFFKPFLTPYRLSILSDAVAVTPHTAHALLVGERKTLSRFFGICPVEAAQAEVNGHRPVADPLRGRHRLGEDVEKLSPKSLALNSLKGTFPVVYRDFVYLCKSEENRQQFLLHPRGFIRSAVPPLAAPIRTFVIGPPAAGKTAVARRLAFETSALRLTPASVVRRVISATPMRAHGFEQLRSVIVDKLQAGQELSDVDITACLKAATSSEEVGSRGFVLDGWPRTEAQAILLEEAGIVPSTVVEISTSDATCRARGPIDVEPQLDSYHRSNSKSTPSSFYRRLRGNVVTVDGEQSRWAVYAAAERSVMATQQAESHYRQRISAGQPAKLSTLGGVISLDSFRRGLSAEFGGYCPVSFKGWMKMVVKEVGTSKTPRRRQHAAVHDAEYDVVEPHLCLFGGVTSFAAVGSNEKVLENAVEYDGKYYKLAGDDEVKLFLDKPDFFLHRSRIEDVPHHIPLLQTKELYAFAQHNGYCPVKLADAPEEGPVPASCLERGRRRFLAMYKGKFFALSSADALSSFLRTPWKYTDGKLPLKLPHVVPENEAQRTLPIGNLPTLGYLEQTVSAVLLSALNEVGKERPFLPSADAKTSAVRLLAGIIRANNPNAKPFQKRRAEEELAKMREDMTLVDYLSEKLAKRGGGESDEEVNSKLERYNELEEGRVYAPSSH